MEAFSHRICRSLRILLLVLQIILITSNTFCFVKEFNMIFFNQYISSYLGHLGYTIFNATILWKEPAIINFNKEGQQFCWAIDSTRKETERRILKEVTLIKIIIKAHLLFVAVTSITLFPFGKEREFQFAIYSFREYFGSIRYFMEAIFCGCFPLIGFVITFLVYCVLHLVYNIRFQMYMFLDCINFLSADYEDVDDTKLLESAEYQKVIKERLHFLVIRHNELLRLASTVCDLAAQLLPPFTISGILAALSSMSFFYLGDFFGYWCYFQNFMWCLSTVATGVLIIKCGQNYEDASETIFSAIYETRWLTFNKSNRKTILLILMNSEEPLKMKFTEHVACNYQLGMALTKNLYSFAAVMARLGNFQSLQ